MMIHQGYMVTIGNPIFGNIMTVGALAVTGDLPMSLNVFEQIILKKISTDKVAINLNAYKIGKDLIRDEKQKGIKSHSF